MVFEKAIRPLSLSFSLCALPLSLVTPCPSISHSTIFPVSPSLYSLLPPAPPFPLTCMRGLTSFTALSTPPQPPPHQAWAKLHLSYEATAGGLTEDAHNYLSVHPPPLPNPP